jgi:Uma2 family endonuclease
MSAAAIVLDLPVRTQTSVQPQVQRKVWTYEDYLNLPDDGRRYEIIEEVLYVSNAPNIEHQFIVVKLFSQLEKFVTANKIGYVLTAPFEVHLSQRTRPVQPDVLFIRQERWPKTAVKYFEGAPDLVVEVLSASTRRVDQTIKFTAYEQAKVPEYWMVDPKTRFVQVFTLNENQEYDLLGEFLGEELIESKVLVGLRIVTESLFMVHG